MQIAQVIEKIKRYHKGYGQIDEAKTRDQVLWGNPNQECTGIVICIWPSVEIIRRAIEYHANLIITHEALFWNHGDHTDWLEEKSRVYEEKIKLLDQGNICVWRDHDYIHSGIPVENGQYADGIFYGFACEAGWKPYLVNRQDCMSFQLPKTTVKEIGKHLLERFNLEGMKLIGNLDQPVEKVDILFHVLRDAKDEIIACEQGKRDLMICMELVDYTLSEYVKDASILDHHGAILCMGHFNTEEPGMRYMLNYLPKAIDEPIPAWFESTGDMYHYLTQ